MRNSRKPVDTQKREYENIDDITRGFVVKDGKIMYVTNILDGCRHEFKDIYEICDELNNDMNEIDRLMELNNHLRVQLDELNPREVQAVKEFADRLKVEAPFKSRLCCKEYDIGYNDGYSETRFDFCTLIDELLKEYENETTKM